MSFASAKSGDSADQEDRGPWAAFFGDPATMENRFRQHTQVSPRYIDMGSSSDGSEPKISCCLASVSGRERHERNARNSGRHDVCGWQSAPAERLCPYFDVRFER